MKETGYKAKTQIDKNIAWFLPRPKPDHYKGGMPLYCEKWLIDLSMDILNVEQVRLMNVFCGMNKYGVRVDLNKKIKPDFCVDVHKMSDIIPTNGKFDVILADPPYSNEESKELYNTPGLNYKKWTSECDKFLKVGGLLIIYHKYVMPNPDPNKYEVAKRVFIGNRTYHPPRVAIYFRKKK